MVVTSSDARHIKPVHNTLGLRLQCGIPFQHKRVVTGDHVFHFAVRQFGELVVAAQRRLDVDGNEERFALLVVLE